MMAARKLKFKPKPSVNVLNIRREKEADEAVITVKEEEKILKNLVTNLESKNLGVSSEENGIVNGDELNKNNIDCKPLENSLSLAENNERLDGNLVSSPQSNDTSGKRVSEEVVATENVMNTIVVSALNTVSIVENTGCGDAVLPLAADSNDKSKTVSNKPGSSGRKVFSRLGRSQYKPILSNPDLRKKGDAGTISEVSQPKGETLEEEPRVKCEVTINSTNTKLSKEEVLENSRPSVTDTSSIVHQLNNQRTESVIKSVQSELSKTQPIVSEITESFPLLEDSEKELPHKLNLNRASHASGNFSLSNNVDTENINIDVDSSVNLKEIVHSNLKKLNDSNNYPVSLLIFTDVKSSDNLEEIIQSSLKPSNSSNKVPVSPVIFRDVNGSDNIAEIIRSSLKTLNSSNKVPVSPVRTTSKVLVPKPSPRTSEVNPRRISFQGSDSEDEVKKNKSYRKKDSSKISNEAKDNNSQNNSKHKRSQGSMYSKMSQETLENISKKFGKNEEPDKTKLTMRDLIFYNPKNNPMPQSSYYKPQKKEKTMEIDETIEEKMEEEKVDDVEPAAMPVPQLKIGPDGQIMLDPQSLVIETTGTEEGRAKLEKSEVIQDTGITRYSTYRKKRHVRQWSKQGNYYKRLSSYYKPQKKEKTMEIDETIEEKMEEEKVDDVEPAAMPVPQLKIGPDGQIMLDPQSLVIETTGTEEGRAKLEKSEVIQDTGITRYSTYRKKRHVRQWSKQGNYYKRLSSYYKPQKKEKTMEIDETIEEKMEEEKVDDVEPAAMPVPQLKIGPDGQIMLDPQSLVIETTGTEEGRAKLEKSEVIQDTGITRYSTYRKKRHVRQWSKQETVQFFIALNSIGTDFTLMTKLFPNRSRHELKLKFKREEKANPHLVNRAMTEKSDFDLNSLQKEFQRENDIIIKKNKEMKLAAEAAQKERAMKKEEMLKNKLKRKPGNRYRGRRMSIAMKDFNETDRGTCYNQKVKSEPGQRNGKRRKVFKKESSDSDMGEQLYIDFQSSSEDEEQQLNLLHAVRQTQFGCLPKQTSKLEEYEEINETLGKKLQQESDTEEDGYIPNSPDAQMLFGSPLPDDSTPEIEDHNDLTKF